MGYLWQRDLMYRRGGGKEQKSTEPTQVEFGYHGFKKLEGMFTMEDQPTVTRCRTTEIQRKREKEREREREREH